MDKRFFSFFNLTEEQAIALLDTPQDQISENDSRYIAASHLINFPTEQSIQALMRAVQQDDPVLENRIVRRKSLETLGRLKAEQALPLIRSCLGDEDCYTVENAVWAIGEIGTQNSEILEEIAGLLAKPKQTYRVIIHTLAKSNYKPALEKIRHFVDDSDVPTASAAITAVCRLSQDYSDMGKVVAILQNPAVLGRRLAIQDLIDARYYTAIPDISRCPVSLVFRLRGIRMLAEAGIQEGKVTFETIQPALEQSLFDHPETLSLVHRYEELPPISALIRGLYETDFGRCYLASKLLIEQYAEAAPSALFQTYEEEAYTDYGAHFHVVKLFGWLKHAPAYNLLLEALQNQQPQFQKSRAAAAIALGELGDPACIPYLKASLETKIWDLKYAALMSLEKLGDTSGREIAAADEDWLVRAKAEQLCATLSC
ncbi:HEAT repeat domain-containing protein [Calothrix sp. PCC 6303]|uniref:HEAT repeat domain-containing protein n=1 Tax=Calothrix sp. PCC 6303 TaxID=1170562 RepID=UPI0002A02937|nr:HEAT repeat domain-containing protein [Calothrix sp. PCC 6303]AFZ00072.1 PBS lyase HEAT domain protein repeat-containing protein [Calothrix sp. PCC 6303]